jgi:hypothetical protein
LGILGILGTLGILGIENRKPKIVNCKFFLSFQAGNNYQKFFLIKNYFYFYFYFYFIFASTRTQPSVRTDSRAEGGRGGGEGGRGGGEGGRGEGRMVHPRGRWGASARMPHVCADAKMHPCGRQRIRADTCSRPRGRECFTPCNL